MKKVGIIRCRETEELCPGSACFTVCAGGRQAFAEYGVCEIVGFVSCGGCPGKHAVSRVQLLIDRGAEIVAFASCINKGTPIGFPCPHAAAIMDAVRRGIGDRAIILEYTH